MFSKKNANRFTNLVVFAEIIMILTWFFPLNNSFEFIVITIIFIIPFVYVIYMAIYYLKKKKLDSSSIDE